MKSALEQIVNAIVSTDCISYPDRESSRKRYGERFTSGRVYPQIFSEMENGTEPCAMQTECLFQACSELPRLKITLGFLQPVAREFGAFEKIVEKLPENEGFRFQTVPQFEVAGKTFHAWMEAVDRKVSIIANDLYAPARISFAFPANERRETIQHEGGSVGILRRDEVLEGKIEIKMTRLQDNLFKICARALNTSSIESDEIQVPEKVLLRTFVSTHFTLEAEGGEFISLLGAPADLEMFADDCKNIGCWPVLAAGDRKTILASPIIPNDSSIGLLNQAA